MARAERRTTNGGDCRARRGPQCHAHRRRRAIVTVEVHVSSGLPTYQVVGLPDAAVRESRDTVRAAVLVEPAVASEPHHGRRSRTSEDAQDEIGAQARRHARGARCQRTCPRECWSGSRCSASSGWTGWSAAGMPARSRWLGTLAQARRGVGRGADRQRLRGVRVGDMRVRDSACAGELGAASEGSRGLARLATRQLRRPTTPAAAGRARQRRMVDLADVRGCPVRPPGAWSRRQASTTSSLFCGHRHRPAILAQRLSTIVPPLGPRRWRSPATGSGFRRPARWSSRPATSVPRAHHTASTAALVGGGSGRGPSGGVTLAHRGILFLGRAGARLPPTALDPRLRQPLKSAAVHICNEHVRSRFPPRLPIRHVFEPVPVRFQQATHDPAPATHRAIWGNVFFFFFFSCFLSAHLLIHFLVLSLCYATKQHDEGPAQELRVQASDPARRTRRIFETRSPPLEVGRARPGSRQLRQHDVGRCLVGRRRTSIAAGSLVPRVGDRPANHQYGVQPIGHGVQKDELMERALDLDPVEVPNGGLSRTLESRWVLLITVPENGWRLVASHGVERETRGQVRSRSCIPTSCPALATSGTCTLPVS